VTTLSTWTFDTPQGAERAVRRLARLPADRPVTVQDAAVVSWPPGRRKPVAWSAGDLVGTAALSGAFWGLLFGILFLLPLAGPVDATKVLGSVGLPEEFLRRVRAGVAPGTSALFLLTSDEVLDRVAAAIVGPHTGLLVSTLSPAQEAALRHAFDDGEDAPTADPVAAPAG
jgi:uncharacterized membrane protein